MADKLAVIAEIIPGGSGFNVVDATNVGYKGGKLSDHLAAAEEEVINKANKDYVDTELAKKTNTSDFNAYKTSNNAEVAKKANSSDVNTELAKKVNVTDFNSYKSTNDAAVASKVNKSYVDTELAKKANVSDLSGKADAATVSALAGRVSTNETNIAAANSRIDQIVAIPPGSTEGNTELIDIRTGADGKSYTTAGNAVRGQVTALKSDLDQIKSGDIKESADIYKTKTIVARRRLQHASNVTWCVSFKMPLAYLKFTPTFVDEDSKEVSTGEFTWKRVKTNSGSSVKDNEVVTVLEEHTVPIGSSIVVNNLGVDEAVAVKSNNLNSYSPYKESDIFNLSYINNSNTIANYTGMANSQMCGVYEYCEYGNAVNDKYENIMRTFISTGNCDTYNTGANSTLANNLFWGVYPKENYKNVSFVPTLTYTTGTYKWTLYKSESGNELAINDKLFKVCEGETPCGESIFFEKIGVENLLVIGVDDRTNAEKLVRYTTLPKYNGFGLGRAVEDSVGAITKVTFTTSDAFRNMTIAGTFKFVTEKGSSSDILAGKRWAVFGDSLTEKNPRATTSYYDYIADRHGMTIVNYGSSGTGYKNSEWDNKAFYQRMANIDPDSFDVLTIFGSGNDRNYNTPVLMGNYDDTGTDTLWGCVNTTISTYYEKAPFKPIAIITPCAWKNYPTSTPDNWMDEYANGLIEIAKRWGIPCLDLYHSSGLRPWDDDFRVKYYNENGVQDEGIHPNSEGHKVFLAPKFEEFIKTLFY